MATKATKKTTKPAKKSAPAKKSSPMKSSPKAASKPAPAKKATTSTRPRNGVSYTLTEMVENIRAFCGLEKRSCAKETCEDIARFVKDSLKRGYKIPLFGLGKMYVRTTKPRQGRNPMTNEVIQIPSKKRVRFAPAKALKEAVL